MTTADKKQAAIDYYAEVPVFKYTAMAVGVDRDTLLDWRKKDPAFSARLLRARADWVKKHVRKARHEFNLERLEKEIFAERKELEHSGEVAIPILGGQTVQTDDSNEEGTKA